MKRCINIDWLEVYCLEDSRRYPCNADYYRSCGYSVVQRDYGTRVYGEMFTIEDERGYPLLEVRRKPLSDKAKDGGLFDERSCHIRLSNYSCYRENPVGVLRNFLAQHGYTLVKIFRIDICLDFTKFDKGDEPLRFVRRYIVGKYSKVNQTNVAAHGKDTWETRCFNSLSWGAKKSMVSTKMYNKSLELDECHDKPYIKWSWYLAGLVDNPISGTCKAADGTITKPDVWRVEFSIKSSAKKWFVIEDCNRHKKSNVYMPHTLDMYDTKEKLLVMFASLARHYFHFKVFEEGKRKDRCADKVLFVFNPSDIVYQPKGSVAANHKVDTLDRLIRYLDVYRQSVFDDSVLLLITQLLDVLRSKQVYRFAGGGLDAESIMVLQRLISERTGALNGSRRIEAERSIRNIVHDCFGEIW